MLRKLNIFSKKLFKSNVFCHSIICKTYNEKKFFFKEFGIENKFFNFLSLRYDNDMALSNDFKEIYYDELLKVWEASFLLLLQSVISVLSSDYYLPGYFFFMLDGDDEKIMHWSENNNRNLISKYWYKR